MELRHLKLWHMRAVDVLKDSLNDTTFDYRTRLLNISSGLGKLILLETMILDSYGVDELEKITTNDVKSLKNDAFKAQELIYSLE